MSTADILKDPEDFQRRHILLYKILHYIHWGVAGLSHQTEPLPCRSVPMSILLIPSLSLLALTLVPLAIFRYDPPEVTWLYLFLGVLLFALLAASEIINRKVIDTLTQNEVATFQSPQIWRAISRDIPFQLWPGIIAVVVGLPIAWVLYRDVFGLSPAWPVYVFTAITSFFWGLGSYVAICTSIRLSSLIKIQQMPLYMFNPQHSPIISSLSAIYETALWSCSVTLVILLSPMVFVPRTPLIIITAILLSVVGFTVLIALFLNAQTQLSRIVNTKKREVLTDLQCRIEQFYNAAEGLDKDTFTELQNLMNLHDQVVKTGNRGLSATRTARYLTSFILPLVTAFYANQGLTKAILEQVNSLSVNS